MHLNWRKIETVNASTYQPETYGSVYQARNSPICLAPSGKIAHFLVHCPIILNIWRRALGLYYPCLEFSVTTILESLQRLYTPAVLPQFSKSFLIQISSETSRLKIVLWAYYIQQIPSIAEFDCIFLSVYHRLLVLV